MGIKNNKDKKPAYAFSDVIRGLQSAVSGAQDMLQAQQVQNLSAFWDSRGNPITRKVKLGAKDMEVPLFALVSHNQLAMDDVEIKFKSRIGNVQQQAVTAIEGADGFLPHAELQVEMDGVSPSDDDVMEVTVRFKIKDTPEAVSRLMDEYNKQI